MPDKQALYMVRAYVPVRKQDYVFGKYELPSPAA